MTGKDPTNASGRGVSPIVAGVLARCPRCGRGSLFHNGLMLKPSCDGCGLDYKFIDTGDGPAVFAILILGFVVLGGALFVEFRYEPPVWVHVVLWGIVTPLLAFGLLRFLKAILIALQWVNKAEEGRLAKDDA
ncbi:DUF983 domain-containing protein [Hyphomicrobium sp. LHD-15]|uniref:DUF983 domain-containing protein n=1 Tax=Hyphomicrobium sp. LHD-15 TaxID=3072142 RepID=UPI0028100CF8|nr:DUF983 domain-containing protein [Hyphomicrobium sp. LHD-15]MDQ8699348.1 DUF983 domain-containing protein [Hyphomicrobium sp. LHD-15]